MKHLAIYNATSEVVEFEESIDETATVPVMAMIKGKEVKTGEVLEIDQRRAALHNECLGRGTIDGEWKVYEGDNPFSWEAVNA